MYHIFTTFVRNIIYLYLFICKSQYKIDKKIQIKLIEKFNIDLVAKMVNVSILAILFFNYFLLYFPFLRFFLLIYRMVLLF